MPKLCKWSTINKKQLTNMNIAELIRTTTEPLNGAMLREILQQQQTSDASSVDSVKPLNLWK